MHDYKLVVGVSKMKKKGFEMLKEGGGEDSHPAIPFYTSIGTMFHIFLAPHFIFNIYVKFQKIHGA